MKLAIMQPYFFPYIGYFQLIAACDKLVIYDNIKYTKKGWINRNQFLLNGKAVTFSIPLVKDSDFLNVRDRQISPVYRREKLIKQLESIYRCAPQFANVFPEMVTIISCKTDNLFEYVRNSIQRICNLLSIHTQLITSSQVPIDHSLKSQNKVLAICEQLKANKYINTIGGMELYSHEQFQDSGVNLQFIKSNQIAYPQFDNIFVSNLSIIDVLMFNPLNQVKHWLRNEYSLI